MVIAAPGTSAENRIGNLAALDLDAPHSRLNMAEFLHQSFVLCLQVCSSAEVAVCLMLSIQHVSQAGHVEELFSVPSYLNRVG